MMLTFNLHFLTIWTTRIRWRLLHLDFLTNIVISPARRIISSIKPITFRIPIISRDCVACELGGFISRTRQIIFYYPIISRWYTLGICQFLQKYRLLIRLGPRNLFQILGKWLNLIVFLFHPFLQHNLVQQNY